MKKVILFTRVSSKNQSLQRQVDELNTYATANNYEVVTIIKEKISGRTDHFKRTGIEELKHIINTQQVDEVLVHELSRIGRDTRQTLDLIHYLHENKVSLFVYNLNLSSLNPDGSINPLSSIIFNLISQFAEMEVDSLRQRVKSGMARKKRTSNITWGRKKGSTESKEKYMSKHKKVVELLRETDLSIRQIAKLTDRSLQTILNVKKKLVS